MQDSRRPKRESFTVFRSASEEAEIKLAKENWDGEGGHIELHGRLRRAHAWLRHALQGCPGARSWRAHRACIRDNARGGGVHSAQHAASPRAMHIV